MTPPRITENDAGCSAHVTVSTQYGEVNLSTTIGGVSFNPWQAKAHAFAVLDACFEAFGTGQWGDQCARCTTPIHAAELMSADVIDGDLLCRVCCIEAVSS